VSADGAYDVSEDGAYVSEFGAYNVSGDGAFRLLSFVSEDGTLFNCFLL